LNVAGENAGTQQQGCQQPAKPEQIRHDVSPVS
jgi:hypothetical protein